MRIIIKYQKGLFSDLKLDSTFARKVENAVLKTSLLRMYGYWSDLANEGLNSARSQYVKSLSNYSKIYETVIT